MRISTQQIYDGGAARMGDVQTALDKLRQQIATSRRMLSPSAPSRSASLTASATTRFLLRPASDAASRCSLADMGLLVRWAA